MSCVSAHDELRSARSGLNFLGPEARIRIYAGCLEEDPALHGPALGARDHRLPLFELCRPETLQSCRQPLRARLLAGFRRPRRLPQAVCEPSHDVRTRRPATLKQAAAIVASFVYDAANRKEMLPRKPLP